MNHIEVEDYKTHWNIRNIIGACMLFSPLIALIIFLCICWGWAGTLLIICGFAWVFIALFLIYSKEQPKEVKE